MDYQTALIIFLTAIIFFCGLAFAITLCEHAYEDLMHAKQQREWLKQHHHNDLR